MHRIWRIAQREYLANVRTKGFIIGVGLTPLLCLSMFFLPRLLEKDTTSSKLPPLEIAVIDPGGQMIDAMKKAETALLSSEVVRKTFSRSVHFETVPITTPFDLEAARAPLEARTERRDLDGYLVFPEQFIETREGGVYYTSNLMNQKVTRRILQLVLLGEQLLRLESLSPEVLYRVMQALTQPARISALPVGSQAGERQEAQAVASVMTPFIFVFLLFFGIFGIGQALLTSVLEEKNQRIIEVLLSSVTPYQLMVGKLLGTCLVGLTLVCLWGICGYATAALQGLTHLIPLRGILGFLVYYLLGFFFLASILAALGSISNDHKDAQNLLASLSIIMVLPLMIWPQISEDPNGTLAQTLSFIPPLTPFIMMARISASPPPPAWEIAATIGLLIVSLVIALWAMARVFRVGILMYGKPPNLREIWRWIRED